MTSKTAKETLRKTWKTKHLSWSNTFDGFYWRLNILLLLLLLLWANVQCVSENKVVLNFNNNFTKC